MMMGAGKNRMALDGWRPGGTALDGLHRPLFPWECDLEQ